MPAKTVRVALGDDAYDITIRSGLLAETGQAVASLVKAKKAAVITDSKVAPHYFAALERSLRGAGIDVISHTLPEGEDHKTLSDLLPCYDTLLGAKIDRHTPVVALGGGVVGDMAGFVAATLLRGVPFIQIPTTLLAMVDASIGGKTGVNHAVGKNLIGAFHQPIAVLIDPDVLQTLPAPELRGGLAECIKHDCIRDAEGFAQLEKNISRALALDIDYLAGLIAHNIAIKARVVESDPFEKGERAHLNFGHTFGHAIEAVSKFRYSHGESVALGMVAASELSLRLGLLDKTARDRIVALITAAGLPARGLDLPIDALVERMSFDKKTAAGRIRFVLLDRLGHAMIRDDVPATAAREAMQTLYH